VPGRKITFEFGTASDSFDTHLTAGQSQGYLLWVMAGQRMFITVMNDTRVLVLDPQDNRLTTAAIDAGQWVIDTPQSGDSSTAMGIP
jgi:hypothetical protein